MCDKSKNNRHSIRLRGYDYSQPGGYFVTICTQEKYCVLGEVVDGEVILNNFGQIVKAAWKNLSNHYQHVELDQFVIMPNHIHGIIVLAYDYNPIISSSCVGAGLMPAPAVEFAANSQSAASGNCHSRIKPAPTGDGVKSGDFGKRPHLSEIIRGFKSFSARRINRIGGTTGQKFWQRNYYERIIRNHDELIETRKYIFNNPQQWEYDKNNPEANG